MVMFVCLWWAASLVVVGLLLMFCGFGWFGYLGIAFVP